MMTNDKLAELQREGQAYIAKAREIADRNPGHPSSWSEPILADYNEQVAKAGEKLTEIREAKDDLAVIDKARDLTAPILGREKSEQLIGTVFAIETVTDVRGLRPLLQRG